MCTTSKKYKFCIYFNKPIPEYTGPHNDYHFHVFAKSVRGAENYLHQQAAFFTKNGGIAGPTPIRGTIQYNTQKGQQTREILFEREKEK